jgi:elongation factor Ts
MWENLQIGAYKIVEWGVLAHYVHSNGKLASLVVAKEWVDVEKAKQVAMHVVASNPEYLRWEDIDNEVVEKEKQVQLEIMKADPKMAWKPDEVLLKIIEWKLGKFKAEISLFEQDFVIDPSKKVKDFIGESSLTAFYRFKI